MYKHLSLSNTIAELTDIRLIVRMGTMIPALFVELNVFIKGSSHILKIIICCEIYVKSKTQNSFLNSKLTFIYNLKIDT